MNEVKQEAGGGGECHIMWCKSDVSTQLSWVVIPCGFHRIYLYAEYMPDTKKFPITTIYKSNILLVNLLNIIVKRFDFWFTWTPPRMLKSGVDDVYASGPKRPAPMVVRKWSSLEKTTSSFLDREFYAIILPTVNPKLKTPLLELHHLSGILYQLLYRILGHEQLRAAPAIALLSSCPLTTLRSSQPMRREHPGLGEKLVAS